MGQKGMFRSQTREIVMPPHPLGGRIGEGILNQRRNSKNLLMLMRAPCLSLLMDVALKWDTPPPLLLIIFTHQEPGLRCWVYLRTSPVNHTPPRTTPPWGTVLPSHHLGGTPLHLDTDNKGLGITMIMVTTSPHPLKRRRCSPGVCLLVSITSRPNISEDTPNTWNVTITVQGTIIETLRILLWPHLPIQGTGILVEEG